MRVTKEISPSKLPFDADVSLESPPAKVPQSSLGAETPPNLLSSDSLSGARPNSIEIDTRYVIFVQLSLEAVTNRM